MPLSNSGLGNINISLPPNIASTVILEPVEGIAAGNVQTGIAELATKQLAKSENLSDLQDVEVARNNLVAARSGENSDITSLGSLDNPIAINGNLSIPNTSRFLAYQTIRQSIEVANIYTKAELQTEDFDKLNEFDGSRFTVKAPGVYLLNGAIGVEKPSASPDWRIILTVYVNGSEYARGNDVSLALPYGGTSVTAICFLNVDDYAELFIYTNYPCLLFSGSAVTRLSGIRIA